MFTINHEVLHNFQRKPGKFSYLNRNKRNSKLCFVKYMHASETWFCLDLFKPRKHSHSNCK